MPFFDIPKPLVKAFVARPRRSANRVADAISGPFSKRRPSWAKLGRPKSKGSRATQNHNQATGREDVDADEGTVDEEPVRRLSGVVRRASSSLCLCEETSSEDEGDEQEEQEWEHAELDDDHELTQWWSGMQEETERRRRRPWSAFAESFSSHAETAAGATATRPIIRRRVTNASEDGEGSQGSDGGSDSDETAVPTPAGSATPVENLSRSSSYKIAKIPDVDRGSPFHTEFTIPAVSASLREATVDPHGLRIVPKNQTSAAKRDARRYEEVLALPSFRPLHPAIAFDDEAF
ncbi:hypothetical protein C8Q80DRAFT_194895 [Daedaleopsis nitida]|nr:hypothetical protein C8Q80DRAFT_194895 [Daedaleopsis nitida]